MADAPNSKTSLAAELDRLRRRVAELEASAVSHQRAEQQLESDARLSEAALRRSQDTAQAVLESASEGIVLIDTAGRITLVNAAAERMFGYPRSALLGEPLETLLPGPGSPSSRTACSTGSRSTPCTMARAML